jgi:hypothetical protein
MERRRRGADRVLAPTGGALAVRLPISRPLPGGGCATTRRPSRYGRIPRGPRREALWTLGPEYERPFQSHASMGPACAVVDARADGATLWTGSQKPHFARDGVARALGLPQDKVHGIWVPGPGSYGRNDAGDAGIDAALLSKAVGRPVRVQGMRHEGHGWDPKGPASIHRARAALGQDGAVIGYAFESKGFSRIDIDTNESDPAYSLGGPAAGPAVEVTAGLWRARRILRLRQQAAGLGDDPAITRPRFAIAYRASARPGRPADPVRQRILHR